MTQIPVADLSPEEAAQYEQGIAAMQGIIAIYGRAYPVEPGQYYTLEVSPKGTLTVCKRVQQSPYYEIVDFTYFPSLGEFLERIEATAQTKDATKPKP